VTKKQSSTEDAEAIAVESKAEETKNRDELFAVLKEICTFVDVQGYILKDSTTATINLEDSEKTTSYAMLSSQAFESAEVLRQTCRFGENETMLVDCADLKVLCTTIGEAAVSIFMGKEVDHTKILSKLLSL